MWLIDTSTINLHWVENPKEERYAILSHFWDHGIEAEQSFQDIRRVHEVTQREVSNPRHSTPLWEDIRFSRKIRGVCALAHANGYRYVWIDTCCIDRTNPVELADALASMYSYYAHAHVCYAYLRDVSRWEPVHAAYSAFRRSRWFTRLWTLQELIAPTDVVFLSRTWDVLGTKDADSLGDLIAEITRVPIEVLTHRVPLSEVSVARRMSWAASRKTSLPEDEAYALMGLFGVQIAVAYGEGRLEFIRLQQAILAHTHDQSLFAWGGILGWESITHARWEPHRYIGDEEFLHPGYQLFADRPAAFGIDSGAVSRISFETLMERIGRTFEGEAPPMTITNLGVQLRLPILYFRVHDPHRDTTRYFHLGLLACEDSQGHVLALVLSRRGPQAAPGLPHEYSVDCIWQFNTLYRDWQVRVVTLPRSKLAALANASAIPIEEIHILNSVTGRPLDTLPEL